MALTIEFNKKTLFYNNTPIILHNFVLRIKYKNIVGIHIPRHFILFYFYYNINKTTNIHTYDVSMC